ncbi:hypothetical protein GCM10014713_61190 [Streptomyces purpureus]|uniref:Uncharacterized protein n=2 Tax=Streptomyces purpureus TaxID=1951 RepID=A0A918HEX8_9ACTN|nr:hypothetical protein GCM10014713_61190 [Streptomyces purpureus]
MAVAESGTADSGYSCEAALRVFAGGLGEPAVAAGSASAPAPLEALRAVVLQSVEAVIAAAAGVPPVLADGGAKAP